MNNNIFPEINEDVVAQKADIMDRVEALAIYMPTTNVIIAPVPYFAR